jgi:hypothetical protein
LDATGQDNPIQHRGPLPTGNNGTRRQSAAWPDTIASDLVMRRSRFDSLRRLHGQPQLTPVSWGFFFFLAMRSMPESHC